MFHDVISWPKLESMSILKFPCFQVFLESFDIQIAIIYGVPKNCTFNKGVESLGRFSFSGDVSVYLEAFRVLVLQRAVQHEPNTYNEPGGIVLIPDRNVPPR